YRKWEPASEEKRLLSVAAKYNDQRPQKFDACVQYVDPPPDGSISGTFPNQTSPNPPNRDFFTTFYKTQAEQWAELHAALREKDSEQQRRRASAPRKKITTAALNKSRDDYVRKHGSEHGWKKVACLQFGMTPKTLKKKMVD